MDRKEKPVKSILNGKCQVIGGITTAKWAHKNVIKPLNKKQRHFMKYSQRFTSKCHTADGYNMTYTQLTHHVEELARHDHTEECLYTTHAVDMFLHFIQDPEMDIKRMALIGLARLATHSEELALAIINKNVVQYITLFLTNCNHHVKAACMYLLRSASQHSYHAALAVIEAGGLQIIFRYLRSKDSRVAEAAARTVGYIGGWTKITALKVSKMRILTILENFANIHKSKKVKLYAAFSLLKMSEVHKQIRKTFNINRILSITRCLMTDDFKITLLAMKILFRIAKLDASRAELITDCSLKELQEVLISDKLQLRKYAAGVISMITKQSQKAAAGMITAGVQKQLCEILDTKQCAYCGSALKALGHMASHSPDFAMELLSNLDHLHLEHFLTHTGNPNIQLVAVLVVMHLGKHSEEHANKVLHSNVWKLLIKLFIDENQMLSVRRKCKGALKTLTLKCSDMYLLVLLMRFAQWDIVKYPLQRLLTVLPQNAEGKQRFLEVGGLATLRRLNITYAPEMKEIIKKIESCIMEYICWSEKVYEKVPEELVKKEGNK